MAPEALSGDELARLRAIAEAGRDRPLLGGPPLIAWGIGVAVAALLHWSIVSGLLTLPLWWLGPIWFGTMAATALAAGVLTPKAREGALSAGNRVSRAVWSMAGAFLGVLSLGLFVAAWLAHDNGDAEAWRLMAVIPPVSFGVYGIALTATAVAADIKWLRDFGWVAFGFAGGTAALIGEPAQFVIMAAGALTVLVAPGVRLLRTGGRD